MLATATTYNIKSNGITSFDTFEYNSVAQIGDVIYGAGDNGVFIFNSYDLDDSKQYKSLIITKFFDIFSNWIARLRYMIIVGVGNYVVRVNDGNTTAQHLPDRIASKYDEIFFKLGYGNRERFFQFEFETFENFKLTVASIFGEVRRKVR